MGPDAAPDGDRGKADFRDRRHRGARWKVLQANEDHYEMQWIGLAARGGVCCNGVVVAKRE
jgi:hypothetical protein